jgi:hypothetical protein
LKPARANSSLDSISKKNHHKNRADVMAQSEGLEFKPQYHKNKNKTSKYEERAGLCH